MVLWKPQSSISTLSYPIHKFFKHFLAFSAKPEIEPFTFNENGMNGGSSVRVLCSIITGDQPVEIKWLKDGKPLTEYRRKTQKIDENTVILSLRKLQLEDSGNYTCISQNRAGSASHWGILKVKGTSSSLIVL